MVSHGFSLVERAVSTLAAIVILVMGLDILALTPQPEGQPTAPASHASPVFGLSDAMSDALRE